MARCAENPRSPHPAAKILIDLLLIAVLAGLGALAIRRAFITHLNDIAATIRTDKSALLPRADLPPEVLALTQKFGARSDDLPGFVETSQTGQMGMSPGATPTDFTA